MIKSKFRFWALFPFCASLFLLVILIFSAIKFYGKINSDNIFPMLLVFIFFVLILIWLIWGELRTKAVKVSIDMDRLSYSNFLGLGNLRVLRFSEIDGFKIANLPSEYQDYEYLYVMVNKYKVIKLSEFYHKNYKELKAMISSKSKCLGEEKFSYVQEFKEIFSK